MLQVSKNYFVTGCIVSEACHYGSQVYPEFTKPVTGFKVILASIHFGKNLVIVFGRVNLTTSLCSSFVLGLGVGGSALVLCHSSLLTTEV